MPPYPHDNVHPPPWYIIASIMKSLRANADATLYSFNALDNFGSEPGLLVGRRISTNVVTYTIYWDSVVNSTFTVRFPVPMCRRPLSS
ncbi:MAG: hypothetical protein QI197_08220 [Candidatus Korarchaeota archaeon]|nr:hypothetical protein [Candidatus Korarchaeota archaeon]